MKQLTLTLHIDAAAAVRAGKSQVGETTVTLRDTDLAQLKEEQRETLALHVSDAPFPDPWKYRGDSYSIPRYGKRLTDHAHPVADTSIETIAKLLDTRKTVVAAQLEKFRQEDQETQQKADKQVLAAIAAPKILPKGLSESGRYVNYGAVLHIDVPSLGHVSFSDCSPEVKRQFEAAKEQVDRDAERIRLEALPKIQAIVEERAAKEAALKAAYRQEYERLPKLLRERHAAGFASDAQVRDALQQLFLSDAGYSSGVQEHAGREELKSLTDQEYLTLLAIRENAPEGAECTPENLYEHPKYRPAIDEDDPDEIDADGEVLVPSEERNPRRVVVVQWERVGITVETEVPLS